MKRNLFEYLVNKYHLQEISKEEMELLEKITAENENYQEEFTSSKDLWEVTSKMEVTFDPDLDNQFKKFKAKLSDAPLKKQTRFYVNTWYKVAAAVALIFVSFFLFISLNNNDIKLHVADGKSELTLPDGSKVWLNHSSSISYPENFAENKREVDLIGEAFFEVIKNPVKPFLINTNNTITEVLGTSFSIDAQPDNILVEVVVVSGRVSLSNKGNPVPQILNPGDVGIYNKNDKSILKIRNQNQNFNSWQTGKIIFEDSDMLTVMLTLKDHFGIQFVLDNKELNNCEFTGTFDQASLEEVMKVLAITLGLEYEIGKERVMLKGNGCE